MEQTETKKGGGFGKFVLFLFVALVAMGIFSAYHWNDFIEINGQAAQDLEIYEVVGAVILGVVGLFIGLVGGAIGILAALVAAVIGISLALIGVLSSIFIVAGVIFGPFLLIAAIILLMRRRHRPEMV
jgi:hypothetical protein